MRNQCSEPRRFFHYTEGAGNHLTPPYPWLQAPSSPAVETKHPRVCVCRPLRGSRGEGRTGLGQPRAPEAAVPPPAAPCRAEGRGLRHGSRPAASRTPQPRAASPGPRSNG